MEKINLEHSKISSYEWKHYLENYLLKKGFNYTRISKRDLYHVFSKENIKITLKINKTVLFKSLDFIYFEGYGYEDLYIEIKKIFLWEE